MSDATETLTAALATPVETTPIARACGREAIPYLGALTAAVYSDVASELSALTSAGRRL